MTMVKKFVPPQHTEDHRDAKIHLQPLEETQRLLTHGKSTVEQGPGRDLWSMEGGIHTGAGFLVGLPTLCGITLEQLALEEVHLMEVSHIVEEENEL